MYIFCKVIIVRCNLKPIFININIFVWKSLDTGLFNLLYILYHSKRYNGNILGHKVDNGWWNFFYHAISEQQDWPKVADV